MALLVASLTGCGARNETMSGVQLSAQADGLSVQANGSAAGAPNSAASPGVGAGERHTLVVTEQQHAYMDALQAAGVQPSSELLALSIGSYVCQAQAAGQNNQAVWDYVLPLVRDDVGDARSKAHPGSTMATMSSAVDDACADYIRIATEQLC